jgi:hypothetical protein
MGADQIKIYKRVLKVPLFRRELKFEDRKKRKRKGWVRPHIKIFRSGLQGTYYPHYKHHLMMKWYLIRKSKDRKAWKRFDEFKHWALQAGWKKGYRIFKKDRSKGFLPSNLRVMPDNRLLAFGENKGILAWSKDPRCIVSFDTLAFRINQLGWDTEKALTQPVKTLHRNKTHWKFRFWEKIKDRSVWKTFEEFDKWSTEIKMPRGKRLIERNAKFPISETNYRIVNIDFIEIKPVEKLKALGIEQSYALWVRDRRCKIRSKQLLQRRIQNGWEPRKAVLMPCGEWDYVSTTDSWISPTGTEKTISEWAAMKIGYSSRLLIQRLKMGLSFWDAIRNEKKIR